MKETYANDEEGIWLVRGEDPNCDWGGSHVMPTLGYFSGKYKHVKELAKSLAGWITWGHGGSITKLYVTPVDDYTAAKRAELKARKTELEAEIRQIERDLTV